MISAIISTQNEMHSYFFELVLQSLESFPEIEGIVVDGGSTDGSLRLIETSGARLIKVDSKLTHSDRLNIGLEAATGNMILLQHPQALIEREGLAYLLDHEEDLTWGGFLQRYENKSPMLSVNSWYGNEMKAKRRGILSFDHCPFFRRGLLKEKPYIPTVAGFEETALCFKLKEHSKPQILPFYATASCSRFVEETLLTQSIKWQAKKATALLGLDSAKNPYSDKPPGDSSQK